MSDYDIIREMLERSPIPGKQSTGEDPTVDFDNKTIESRGEGKEIVICRGYVHFYTVISFDAEGRLTDIEAYE